MIGKSAAEGTAVTESVHVQRVPDLPNDESASIAFHHDGSVVIFMRDDLITAAGAAALEAILGQGRTEYHRQWGLPLAIAV
jgi:hypothetical protein